MIYMYQLKIRTWRNIYFHSKLLNLYECGLQLATSYKFEEASYRYYHGIESELGLGASVEFMVGYEGIKTKNHRMGRQEDRRVQSQGRRVSLNFKLRDSS